MTVLKSSRITGLEDFRVDIADNSGIMEGDYEYVNWAQFNYGAIYTEVDLTEFMNKLLELEEKLDGFMGGDIEFDDDTPSAGFLTMRIYTDEATPVLLQTVVINKSTGERTRA